jgi:alpha-1,6-mannosyltransferase
LPLALLSSVISPRIRSLMLPVGLFIGLISCLGHKEWRFVVYAVPMGNVAGGWGLRWM